MSYGSRILIQEATVEQGSERGVRA